MQAESSVTSHTAHVCSCDNPGKQSMLHCRFVHPEKSFMQMLLCHRAGLLNNPAGGTVLHSPDDILARNPHLQELPQAAR